MSVLPFDPGASGIPAVAVTSSPVPLSKCLRFINHGPLVIVTTAREGRVNAAPVQWNTPVNDAPPTVALALDADNFTRALIEETGEFVLNVPDERLLPAVRLWGARSGRTDDKVRAAGAALEPGERVAVPHLREALAYLECRRVKTVDLPGVSLVLGEVVGAGADLSFFTDGQWAPHTRSLHHLGGGEFVLDGERR